ncbi:MAG: hypothetical protein AAFO69_11400 [Bacteroidota bacterium]
MKTKAYILSIICLLIGSASFANHQMEMDTVVIKFGNNSQIVIVTDDADDLKTLEKYDLNKIVKDLNMSLDNSGETKYLVIEDESGKKYLRDTTITIGQDGEPKIYVRSDDDDDDDDDDNDDRDKRDWGSTFQYKRTDSNFEIEIGTSNWLADGSFPSQETYSVRPWGSWYVGLASRQKTSLGGPLFIEWGPSLTWYNWKFEDESVRVSEGDNQIEFMSTASTVTGEVDFIKSKLTASYLNFSFVPMLDFSYGTRRKEKNGQVKKVTTRKRRGIRIGLGGYAGLRLGSKTKIVTNDGGGRDRSKDKDDFSLSNFRYGVRAQFGFKGFDFFANYDLNPIFQDGVSPELNGFSFGIIL